MKMSGFRVITAVGLCVLLTACKGTEQDAQKYLEEGKSLLGQGKIEEARVQLQSALQIQPKLAEGYYQLALIDEKKQDWKGMYKNLSEVVLLDPKRAEAHLKLGQLYLGNRELDKADEQASTVLQLRPDDAGASTLHAGILYARGNKAEALAEVSRVLEKDATNDGAIKLQSAIFLDERRYPEALAILQRGLAEKPKDIGLQLSKIRVEAASNDLDAAVAGYQNLISQYPDDKDLKYGHFVFVMGIGRFEQAAAVLQSIVDQFPADTNAKLQLIDLLEPLDNAKAEKTLKQFVAAQPKELALQSRLADLYWNQKRYNEQQAVLDQIKGIDPKGKEGLSAQVKAARIAVKKNAGKEAEQLIDEVLAVDATHTDALMLRAGMRLDRKETDAAISDLRIILKANPDFAPALVLLANGYLQQGNPALADTTFRKSLELNPGDLEAVIPVVAKLIREGRDLDRAEEIVKKALQVRLPNSRGLEMLVRVRIARKDWAGAQTAVAELAKQPEASASAQLLGGEIFARQGKYEEAIRKYEQALLEKPGLPGGLAALAQAYNATGKRAKLITYLKAFIEKNPKSIEAYNLLGNAYGAEKKWADADKVLRDALAIDPKSAYTYEVLANVYQAQNKSAETVEIYRQGLAELPGSIPLTIGLAQHYLEKKEVEPAITLLNEAVGKNPDNDWLANNLASLLADYRTDKQSLEQAVKLSERFKESTNPNALDTYAWASLQLGETTSALPLLRKVVADAPDVPSFRYHLGVAYYQSADKASAKKELAKALELAKKQGEFIGIERARELLKQLQITP